MSHGKRPRRSWLSALRSLARKARDSRIVVRIEPRAPREATDGALFNSLAPPPPDAFGVKLASLIQGEGVASPSAAYGLARAISESLAEAGWIRSQEDAP